MTAIQKGETLFGSDSFYTHTYVSTHTPPSNLILKGGLANRKSSCETIIKHQKLVDGVFITGL